MLRSKYETHVVLLSLGFGLRSKGSSQRGKETYGFKNQRSSGNQNERRRNGRAVLERRGTEHDREFQKTRALRILRRHDFPSHRQRIHDPGRRSAVERSKERE